MGQYDSPALDDPFEAEDDWDDIREGLAVADDALDVVDHAFDTFSPDDVEVRQDIVIPPKDTPPAVMETDKTYGVAGALAVIQTPNGWVVDVLGRRINPLLFFGALGAIYAAYKLLSPSPRRRRRRR